MSVLATFADPVPPATTLSLSIAVALLQDKMSVYDFVMACLPPHELAAYGPPIVRMNSSGKQEHEWLRFLHSGVHLVTEKEFSGDYLNRLNETVTARIVTRVLSPYFKKGVATLFLPYGPCDRLYACVVACAGVTGCRVGCRVYETQSQL